jgi:hypothetical protein
MDQPRFSPHPDRSLVNASGVNETGRVCESHEEGSLLGVSPNLDGRSLLEVRRHRTTVVLEHFRLIAEKVIMCMGRLGAPWTERGGK